MIEMKEMRLPSWVFILILLANIFYPAAGQGREFYRTFEVIARSKTSLTLRDNDGNVIEVEKAPEDYRVGYKVRYDSIRNRLREYRWQDYTVKSITDKSMTLLHKTGDTLTLAGNFSREYETGDRVRYDSVGEKLQPYDEADQWRQFTVVGSEKDRIVIRNNFGRELILKLDNNLYEVPRGLFIPKYKVGDPVRYNRSTGQLRQGEIRTYDWQDYTVRTVTEDTIVLVSQQGKELVLKNVWGRDFAEGDPVKYDRLNQLLKKAR